MAPGSRSKIPDVVIYRSSLSLGTEKTGVPVDSHIVSRFSLTLPFVLSGSPVDWIRPIDFAAGSASVSLLIKILISPENPP